MGGLLRVLRSREFANPATGLDLRHFPSRGQRAGSGARIEALGCHGLRAPSTGTTGGRFRTQRDGRHGQIVNALKRRGQIAGKAWICSAATAQNKDESADRTIVPERSEGD